uniref:Uncharacterized protein n=1 Tax=Anopheles arabiensis TaxID=7173 RepID=A0A182HG54_ANOAR
MKFTIVLVVAFAILAFATTPSAANESKLKSATHLMDHLVKAPIVSDLLKSLADHINHKAAEGAAAKDTTTPAPPA